MAFRRKFRKRKGGKRRFGRKRAVRRKNYKVTRVKGKGISDTTIVKLTKQYIGTLYNPSDSFVTTQGEIGLNHFGVNNSGVTTPVNYQYYADQYSVCSIMGSKINVQFLNNVSSSQGNVINTANIVGVYPLSETGQNGEAADTFGDQLLQSRSKWKAIGPADGMGRAHLSNYCSTRAMAGHAMDQEEDWKVAHFYTGSNPITFNDWSQPSKVVDWILFAGGPPAVGGPQLLADIGYIATVDYYCKFENKVDIAQHFTHA